METNAEAKQDIDLELETVSNVTPSVSARLKLPSIPSLDWATARFWSLVAAGVLSGATGDPSNPIPQWSGNWGE